MTAAPRTRDLDVVVYGATGFVGRLVAEYLSEHAPARTRIGLAGRSIDRLERVRRQLGPAAAEWPLLLADAGDDASLRALAAATHVVATTVGPYAKYGLPLVGPARRPAPTMPTSAARPSSRATASTCTTTPPARAARGSSTRAASTRFPRTWASTSCIVRWRPTAPES